MDVERSNRAPAAFRASCLGAILALFAPLLVLLAVFICYEDPEAALAAATCIAAFVICRIVRTIGRWSDPSQREQPTEIP